MEKEAENSMHVSGSEIVLPVKSESGVWISKTVRKNEKGGIGGKIAVALVTLILIALLVGTLVYVNIQPARKELQWYHETVIYQIYPRSFKDSNGDGVGDLQGIIEKLDYLQQLGITTIWLSPIYKSPMKDFGYDVADYKDIEPLFGDLNDFDNLIGNASAKGIRLIMDFVPNHTSDQSEWFKLSLQNDTYYGGFYTWHPGHSKRTTNYTYVDNSTQTNVTKTIPDVPNNWMSVFGGSAWTWREERQAYYLHQFLESMPDLNWYNDNVTTEMNAVMEFWLNKNVSGFRVDAIPHMFEVPIEDMEDADETQSNPYEVGNGLTPRDYEYWLHPFTKHNKNTTAYTKKWIQKMQDYARDHNTPPRLLIFEVVDKNISQTIRYFPEDAFGTAAQPFYFGLILELNETSTGKDIERVVNQQMNNWPEGGWYSWVIGNHDQRRAVNRLGNPQLIDGLNMINLLLPGTPTTYYGEEIGMRNANITNVDQIRDPYALNFKYEGPESMMKKTRDWSRGPMQWSSEKNAGFSTNDSTWLPLGPDWEHHINVEHQMADSGNESIPNHTHYHLYRDLIRIRKTAPFRHGFFRMGPVTDTLFSFIREYGDVHYLIAVDLRRNSSDPIVEHDFSQLGLQGTARVTCGSVNIYTEPHALGSLEAERDVDLKKLPLKPSAAIVIRVAHVH